MARQRRHHGATAARARSTATVKGYSGGAHGTLRLTEAAGRTTVAVDVDITVKIRVIGGKIEIGRRRHARQAARPGPEDRPMTGSRASGD